MQINLSKPLLSKKYYFIQKHEARNGFIYYRDRILLEAMQTDRAGKNNWKIILSIGNLSLVAQPRLPRYPFFMEIAVKPVRCLTKDLP